MIISNPKGTQDFLPPYSEQKHYLETQFRKVVALYGFSEIVTPCFEHTELFLRSTGLTTDIVTKQIYSFTDKGGRDLTLRPEGTPGVVRAFLQNNLKPPLRLFYIGPMFRYEKPQKGRYREFYQLGIEVIGEAHPQTDVEVIEMGLNFFSAVNVKDLVVKVNSVGCALCRNRFRSDLIFYLNTVRDKICEDCKARLERNPLRVFDCKETTCQELYQSAPKIADYLCYDCQNHFQIVLQELTERNLPFELDKMMVRGLDYYTRTTFEYVPSLSTALGAQDSLGGGGRYDNLIEDFGGPKIPAIGFALGLERILIYLGNPTLPRKNLVYLIPLDGESEKQAKQLLRQLRTSEIPAILNLPDKNLRSGLGIADNLSCEYVIIIGSEEMKKQVYTVKQLSTKSQQEVPQDKIIEFFNQTFTKQSTKEF
ncbi:MAG: histidine--tRNA ligase [candidate division WOR-3 bacterium]